MTNANDKPQGFFGPQALIGLILLSCDLLEKEQFIPRDKDVALRREGIRLMNYVLPEGGQRNEMSLSQNASIALSAVNATGMNSEIGPIYVALRDLVNEAHQSPDYQMARFIEVVDPMVDRLKRNKDWGIYAEPINESQFASLRHELEFEELISRIVTSGVLSEKKMNYHQQEQKAVIEVPESDAHGLEKLLETMKLPFIRETSKEKPKAEKFTVDLQPMMRNWQDQIREEKSVPQVSEGLRM